MKIAAVREACRSDIQEQCSASTPGAGRLLLCIKRRFAALSQLCKDAIGRAAERKVGTH
jgi:Cysteine rich repeat